MHLLVWLVMAANWCVAQLATWLDAIQIAALGYLAAALLMPLIGGRRAITIARLYVPRLICIGMSLIGFLDPFWAWEFSNWIFAIQVFVLAGGSIDGIRSWLAHTANWFASRRFFGVASLRSPMQEKEGPP